ncbi:hypothetical protein HW132_10915 [Brasilonema sp. CT11]|nr:hypothetical protein [Brasilonema sp. CT11]
MWNDQAIKRSAIAFLYFNTVQLGLNDGNFQCVETLHATSLQRLTFPRFNLYT